MPVCPTAARIKATIRFCRNFGRANGASGNVRLLCAYVISEQIGNNIGFAFDTDQRVVFDAGLLDSIPVCF